jgi:predicted  nucleic acid-binding Zn-ribbon protein
MTEMSPKDLNKYWDQLHSRQSDWAFRAYGRLIKTLSPSVQEKLLLKEDATEPYVVIFGKTQVGKTTLLLDLMGIAPEEISNISRIMRGGREQGKSATATAMEYCRSTDERWGLSIQSKPRWFDSPDELTNALGELRKEMESGQLIVDTPCVVHIPQRLFCTIDSASPKIRILDLPGDDPADKEEQKHVTKMAKTYLPFADLILLVGRGDDLLFLHPDVINLPGIEDWQSMPYRFRVVTTYSFTAQSVRELIRSNEIVDIKMLRRRLLSEIAHSESLSEEAKNENIYFPLEFGTSWEGVKDQDPALYEKMRPIIKELRTQLLTQIATASNPMGRLRSTLNAHLSVKYIQKKKTEATRNEIEKLDDKKSIIKNNIEIFEKKITQTEKEIQRTDDILKNHALHQDIKIIEKATQTSAFNNEVFPPKTTKHENNRQQLIHLISAYWQALRQITLEIKSGTSIASSDEYTYKDSYWIQVRNSVIAVDNRMIEKILDETFSDIRNTLDNYYFDKYFFDDNYKKDYASVCRAGEAAKEKIQEHWKKAWINSLEIINKKYNNSLKKAINEISIDRQEHETLSKELEEITKKISENEKNLEKIFQDSKNDLERCDRFVSLLNESYLEEIKDRMDSIYKNKDDCDALLQILSFTEMKNQRENLMELCRNSVE